MAFNNISDGKAVGGGLDSFFTWITSFVSGNGGSMYSLGGVFHFIIQFNRTDFIQPNLNSVVKKSNVPDNGMEARLKVSILKPLLSS